MSSSFKINHLIYLFTVIVVSSLFFITGCATQNKRNNTSDVEIVSTPGEERRVTVNESLHCISCHKKSNVTPNLNDEWQTNKHAAINVGCKDCHAASSEFDETEKKTSQKREETNCSDKSIQRPVSPKVCGKCHMKQYSEFMQSRHSSSWDSVVVFQKNNAFLSENPFNSCESCHTIQFKCNSCHIQHIPDKSHINSPSICGSCHTGADHPQYEIYMTSQHGMVHSAIQSVNTTAQDSAPLSSPLCVTCHMPNGTHDTSFGLSGAIGDGKSLYSEKEGKSINEEASVKKENDMLAICNKCHSPAFSKKALINAENAQNELNTLLKEAKELVSELDREKLLFPGLTMQINSKYPRHAYFTKGYPINNSVSKAEDIFMRLTKHHAAIVRKALHHMNANYAYSHYWPEIRNDLQELRNEAHRLRQEAEIDRRRKMKLR
ncbi:MAG: hypothetical protein E3K37_05650 [Candidatus Kuenenia sp.]|nr:hypothetical protein [Candidatus Kuenenia hertensis]